MSSPVSFVLVSVIRDMDKVFDSIAAVLLRVKFFWDMTQCLWVSCSRFFLEISGEQLTQHHYVTSQNYLIAHIYLSQFLSPIHS
jgi:hypothetical protein